MSDRQNTEFRLRQLGRLVARLLGAAIGIIAGTVLLGAAMVAAFGAAESSGTGFVPTADGTGGVPTTLCFAGIPPVKYLVEQIGGSFVHVEVLVQPGQDPHTFAPTPRQAIELSKSRLFFRIGLPFEDRLLQQIAGGAARITVVDSAAGIARLASNDADEGPSDPHVWLSPRLLKTMAANIAVALCRADPEHEHAYRTNLKMLDTRLEALDRHITNRLDQYRGQSFYVFHPAFAYFADAYGLRQESVEVEGKPPTPRQIFSLIHRAREEQVRIIFLQPQFNQRIASSIAAAIGGAVIPMDDLALNVVNNLNEVADKIADSKREKAQ